MRSWPVSNCSPLSTHHRRRLHPGGASSVATRTSRAEHAEKCPCLPPSSTQRSPIWPYGPFWNVPQLGSEPVRGSGCGSQGQIDDIIPDGLWAGYVTNETTPAVDIDLLCIFTGAAAQHVVNEATATIVNDEPDYLIVNNSTRTRSMPAAPWIALFDSVVSDGECVGGVVGPHNPDPPRQAWVRIDGGQVTWILWGCGDESPAGPVAAQPTNLPPAYPDYSDGVGSVWPYGPFWNVPRLGREPVRGSGCGASRELEQHAGASHALGLDGDHHRHDRYRRAVRRGHPPLPRGG